MKRLAATLMAWCALMAPGAARAIETPDVAEIILEKIVPRQERLADATLRLKNAVVRHCTIPNQTTLPFLREAFGGVLIATAAAEPLAHTSDAPRPLSERFMTRIADTAFSRSRLDGMIAGSEAPLLTVSALGNEEPALTGLPALAALLFSGTETNETTFERRCAMAQAIAAGLRAHAFAEVHAWETGDVPGHWSDVPVLLANRLRLRDYLQGAIDVSDRLDRMLGEYDRLSEGNDQLPFSARGPNLVYLVALMEALARHVDELMTFAEDGSPAGNVLVDAADALDLARGRFNRAILSNADLSDVRPQIGAARVALVSRLIPAMGFDRSAFVPPIGGFGPLPLEEVSSQ